MRNWQRWRHFERTWPVLQNLLNHLLGMKRSSMSAVSELQMETLDLRIGKRPSRDPQQSVLKLWISCNRADNVLGPLVR